MQVGFSRPLQKEGADDDNNVHLAVYQTEHPSDLWQLPPDWLTDPLTDELEREFYRRCPPDKRPGAWRTSPPDLQARPSSVISFSSATAENEKRALERKNEPGDKHAIKAKGGIDVEEAALPDSDIKRPSERKTSKESQPKQDESLIKALNQVYFWLWWTAGLLTLLGST